MTYIFRAAYGEPWAQALLGLASARLTRDAAEVGAVYADLYAALTAGEHAGLAEAAAAGLLFAPSPLSAALLRSEAPPEGLLAGARHDLSVLLELLRHDWRAEVSEIVGQEVPPLADLSADLGAVAGGSVTALARLLEHADPEEVLLELLAAYRTNGAGDLARFPAFRWSGGALRGVRQPAWTDAERLLGVDETLRRLRANTEAFLAGRRGQHTLLYGPRGSGKSTALRSLGGRYAAAGLRLIEVQPGDLHELPQLLPQLQGRPHRYLLFVDDLSFEAGSSAYGPLKSLLEGSLGAQPGNVRIYATSNRRHLIGERFSERPDPLNDDVHAWDTQHERLALADRFGLVLTFPDATQRRYLEIVRSLAARDGVTDEALEAKAVRFADWGNGYSGRTAQQFLEALQGGLV